MSKLDRILFGIDLVLVTLLAALLWQNGQENRAKQAYLTAYTGRLNPLLAQQTMLQWQLRILESSYVTEWNGTGTLTLVCLTPDEQAYTVLYPELKAHGFAATLVLAPDALPGDPGCITLDEYLQLCADSWQPCLAWDGVTDLDVWLAPVQAWFAANGLAMPQAVYLQPAHYTTGLDAVLQAHGFTAVLHHGEGGLDLITKTDTDLLRVGVAGWNAGGAVSRAADLARTGGATAFAIGFDTADEGTLYGAYEFGFMMAKLAAYEREGELLVTDLPHAKTNRAAADEAQPTLQTDYDAQKQVLEQQCAALADEISEVEATWQWEE